MLSCSTGCINSNKFEEVKKIIDDIDSDSFEFLFNWGFENVKKEVLRVKELEKNFVSVHGLKRLQVLLSNSKHEREALKLLRNMIDFTYMIEAEILVLHCWNPKNLSSDIFNASEILKKFETYSEERGVELSVEVIPSKAPVKFAETFLRKGFHITIDLDFAEKFGFLDDILLKIKYVDNIHIKDVDFQKISSYSGLLTFEKLCENVSEINKSLERLKANLC